MCPLCSCSGTTAQHGGGGACVPYVPVVVLQHSMEEEEHVSLCPCSGTTAQYGGGGACPLCPVVVLQHSMEEEEHVSPMSLKWYYSTVWRRRSMCPLCPCSGTACMHMHTTVMNAT